MISIKEKFSIEELKNRGKYKNNVHIDHIFSVIDGFKNNIDPKIISCKGNIRILSVSENCRKQGKSSIVKDELLKRYKENKNNE